MKTLSKTNWPEWIKDRLGDVKNIEIKEQNGRFYVYEYKHKWDVKSKKVKKLVEYNGRICESRGAMIIKEYGHTLFLYDLISKDLIISLKKFFPKDWEYLTVFAMNRVIQPSPIKRIPSWFEKVDFRDIVSLQRTSPKTISKSLSRVGRNLGSQIGLMRELIEENELLMYDGSVIFSSSKYNKLLEYGYNKEGFLLPQAKILLLFSAERKLPIYMKVLFGSIHDIKTLNNIIDELKDRNIVFVADRGFYKIDGFSDLVKNHIDFVLPLPRDDVHIDYSKEMDKFMKYHSRIIRFTKYEVYRGFIYFYEDQYLKYQETSEFYEMKLAEKKIEFNEKWVGKLALYSTLDKNPEEIYLMYKSRDEIEKSFHILQNVLETDKPYVSRENVFRGYVFGSFLSLYIYYKIMNFLRSKDQLEKISVKDLIFELSKLMTYDGRKVLELPLRTENMLSSLGLNYLVTKNSKS